MEFSPQSSKIKVQKKNQNIFLFHCAILGTFIALDRLLQQIRVVDYVDIFNIVYTMRKGKVPKEAIMNTFK